MHPVLFHFGSLLIPSYGVLAALGVLVALVLVQFTAVAAGATGEPEAVNGPANGPAHLDPRHGWNALVLGLFAAMAASRALLIAINLGNLRAHPRWLLALALIHHPLLSGVGTVVGLAAILAYARWAGLRLLPLGDSPLLVALLPPIALGLAFEQIGCLLAGSDFGIPATTALFGSVTYTSPLAARWSGTPLGIPLVPVQLYAALAAAFAATVSFLALRRGQRGLSSASALLLLGLGLFFTECLRDWQGRGVLRLGRFGAVIDAPQIAALLLVALGLWQWKNSLGGPRHG